MLIAKDWKDYELLAAGDGERLERWDKYILRRPDPQVIWPASKKSDLWAKADARYHRSSKGGGSWEYKRKMPERWTVSYKNLSFHVKPTGFKHTGLFPEQAVNWDWIIGKIHNADRPVKVINLFAYTGAASVAAAYAGAEVCHIDAAKGMVNWAKENFELSGIREHPVRFITDDVLKFVKREKRRGKLYDGIIMDPPSYGRGPSGEVWKIEDELYGLVEECTGIMSEEPLFLLANTYTTGFSPEIIGNILSLIVQNKFGGTVNTGEIGLPIKESGLNLPCGLFGRWEMNL
ncbi:MAG: class I SAM-dependent methyltransferase [Spirochaetes bacterium]|nr:class I SAM-dependent methyltransferase [Spirochaetota bacterium]